MGGEGEDAALEKVVQIVWRIPIFRVFQESGKQGHVWPDLLLVLVPLLLYWMTIYLFDGKSGKNLSQNMKDKPRGNLGKIAFVKSMHFYLHVSCHGF